MIRSMTGYSSARIEENGLAFQVSIKAMNHRNLDLQLRVSAELGPLETLLRQLVKAQVSRGHVEVTVTLNRAENDGPQVDRKLLDTYLAAYRHLRQEFGSSAEPDLLGLLRVPGMLGAEGELSAQQLEKAQKLLERVTGSVLGKLNEMRASEGTALEADLRKRLARMTELVAEVGKLSGGISRLYQRRLERRLQDLLPQEAAGEPALEAARLAQEVAYLASRSDIEEELTRLRSHLDQTRDLLDQSSEAGKKLDFLLQEMNREANTLLSKTTDVPEVGLEIGRHAIEMKTEIEKMREQAQNIE